LAVELRQSKYLDNFVEQDQRAIKRIARPGAGIKVMHMDSQRPARRNQRPILVCSEPVVIAGVLIDASLAAKLGRIAVSRQSPRRIGAFLIGWLLE
jgi:hypothetical protein